MKGINWNAVVKIVMLVLSPLLGLLSPMIRDALKKAVSDLYLKALETENPFDDLLLGFAMDLLGIPKPEAK